MEGRSHGSAFLQVAKAGMLPEITQTVPSKEWSIAKNTLTLAPQ
jgi:hypothetical protein